MKLTFKLNQRTISDEIDPKQTLLLYLRGTACLKGTKEGCSTGHCGACTVLINGIPRRSCITRMGGLDNCEILTIEGMEEEGKQYPGGIHPIASAFLEAGAVQCGFCTPGMLLSAKALLDSNHNPSVSEICHGLKHNYCRCTGYVKIIKAVKMAAANMYPDENQDHVWEQLESTHFLKGRYGARMEWTPKQIVGQAVWDTDGIKKTGGTLVYADDLEVPDCYYGAFVFSGVPYGVIKSIDCANAERMPGVIKILTAEDVPGINGYGAIQMDQPVFCKDKVRFCYDAAALVVADTVQHAREAAGRVCLEIEELDGVFFMEEAIARNEIYTKMIHETGDVEQAKKEKEIVVVKNSFDMPFVEHACMEPESALAVYSDHGVHIYTCTQSPFELQEIIAKNLNLSSEQVHVTATPLGGGFGSKCDPVIEPAAAVAAHVLKHSVKITLSREESMGMTNKRHAYHTEYEAGFYKDGTICYLEAKLTSDGGPYMGLTPGVLEQSLIFAGGPYRILNGRALGTACRTNNAPGGAFRGFGINQAANSMESILDEAARKLGIDVFDIRMINALRPGDRTFSGQVLGESVGMEDAIEACKTWAYRRLEEYKTNYPDRKFVLGAACGYKNVGVGKGAVDDGGAKITRLETGRYLLTVTGIDMGQGFRTAMKQLACEVLNCRPEDIELINGDTKKTHKHYGAVSERQTLNSGRAVVEACRLLIQKDWKPGLRVSSEYQYQAPETYALTDQEARRIKGDAYRNYPSYAYTAQAVILEKISDAAVKVRHVISAHDVGRAINPHIIEGQIEGSCSMGIGYALSERYELKQGYPRQKMYGQLGLPGIEDTPRYDIILIEDPEEEGPFGAKGISEVATVPSTPAVMNAVSQAFGRRISKLPIQK